MWFLNGLLLGLLIMCVLIIYANANRPKRKVCRLPRDHHSIEYKNGTLSFDGMPGYQNIPCRIEIYHSFRYSYDARCRVQEEHTTLRRYKLNLPLPPIVKAAKDIYKIIDSDGICLLAYIGAQDTLIQA